MNVTLTLIKTDELHSVWSVIRPGLEQVVDKGNGGWIPEDVYVMIQNNKASLYIWNVEGTYAGSMVASRNMGFNGATFFILALYVRPMYGKCIDANMSQVDVLAKQCGCKRIGFSTTRAGWSKRGVRLGFTPTTTTYEKEL